MWTFGGPFKHPTFNGHKYFLTIVDHFSRATWTHLFSFKHQSFSILESFVAYVENQFSCKMKVIRSDNGMEFGDNRAKKFYDSKGIVHQTSCVGTPQQNGIVECKHRHLLETTRVLYFQSNLPIS